jgi:hypothetical protein
LSGSAVASARSWSTFAQPLSASLIPGRRAGSSGPSRRPRSAWLLPAGIAAVFAAGLLLRGPSGSSWTHIGGFVLLAGIVVLLAIVGRGARGRLSPRSRPQAARRPQAQAATRRHRCSPSWSGASPPYPSSTATGRPDPGRLRDGRGRAQPSRKGSLCDTARRDVRHTGQARRSRAGLRGDPLSRSRGAWCDVLVEAEEVVGVVAIFERDEARVRRGGVGRADAV